METWSAAAEVIYLAAEFPYLASRCDYVRRIAICFQWEWMLMEGRKRESGIERLWAVAKGREEARKEKFVEKKLFLCRLRGSEEKVKDVRYVRMGRKIRYLSQAPEVEDPQKVGKAWGILPLPSRGLPNSPPLAST